MHTTRGVWQMSLAMIISGSIGAFVLLSGLPVIDVVFWRCLIGALTLLLFIVLSRQPFSRLTRFTLALAVLGGITLVINWLLLFAAYSRISIGMATVVYNTQPFMLVLMGMVLGERVSAVKWGWLLLAFGGVVILLSSELAPAHGESLATGVLLALGAAFFYALTAIIARKLHPLPAQHIAFIQVLVGVVMLLPLVQMPEFSASFPWRYLLILGVVHTGIMYQLLYSAIQKLPTPITGSLSFIYPLVAMGVDYLVFRHALTPVQLIGGMLILFAAAGNNLGWGEKKPRRGGVSEQSRVS
ncbi:TPA: DMT family transporter [Klebsiella quasipneumoniae subsp. similipneumoniae]|nr:DMT family transporter [Klebsiella quasipneumoniae subsp. similipneumoniae]